MLPSTSSTANVPDEVTVRDAALCLRSFCGERQSIPYSKFCERFKKVIGYSLKEHLLKCKFTFADLIEHIAATTRTKCHYDAEHKMIQLLSGQTPNESGSFSNFNPLGAYQSSQIVGPLIPPYPFPLHLDPRLPDVVAASSSRADYEDIVPINSMQHIRLEEKPSLMSHNGMEQICTIFGELAVNPPGGAEEKQDNNFHPEVHHLHQSSMVPQSEGLTWTSANEYTDNLVGQEEEPLFTSHNCLEQSYSSFNEMAVSSSPVNEPEEKQDCSPHREFDDRDESFYDAEDALSPHKSSHGCNVSAVHSGDSVDFSTSLTSEEYFEAASEISRLKLKRSWSCGNMVNDEASELHFGRPNGSALEIRFSNRLTFGLTGDRTDKHECPMEQLRERVVMDLKGGSGCTALYWLRGRKTIRDTSIPKWRGFSRGKFSGTSSQHILKPKTSEQRRVSILKYSSVLVEQDPQDHTDNGEQAPTTRKKDPKQIRIEAKTLCLRKWGDKVRNLSELLWFLQVFYHVNGPVLITKCEEVIERYVDPNGGNGRLPWKRYGRNVDVRRMFELGMFRVTSPKNRMEVQPVDCILNAGFRLVRKGLASELYKLLMKKEKVTTEDLLEHMDPLFENSQKPARLDEIRAAKKKLPDLITTDGVYWELKSNEELFVVTDVNL